MPFAILRTQKLKSVISVQRSMRHAFREQETPNAAKELASQNTHIGAQSVAEGMEAFAKALPAKHRKDAVLAIEYLITASPEGMASKTRADQDRYFADSLAWLRSRHGDTVVYAGIHRDEQTPHMYAYVVPRDPETGRLNARKWLGGAKALQEMQTEFAREVGQAHGLERGIEGSKAQHTKVAQFYAAINQAEAFQHSQVDTVTLEPQMLKKGLIFSEYEKPPHIAARLSAEVEKHYAPVVQKAAVARQASRRADEQTQTARTLDKALKALQERFNGLGKLVEGLTSSQVGELAKQAKAMLTENEMKRRVDALPGLVAKRYGAVRTFAVKAIDAIAKAGGWRSVDWQKVETESWFEAVKEQKQPVKAAFEAIALVSPGHAKFTPAEVKALAAKVPDMPGFDNGPVPSKGQSR